MQRGLRKYIKQGGSNMIEISYGHKIENDILYINKISIGHGLPQHGQLDFISLIREDINMKTAEVIWATHVWGWGFWRIRRKKI